MQTAGSPVYIGIPFTDRSYLPVFADICAHLRFALVMRETQRSWLARPPRQASRKHRYTHISTDLHRWASRRISWPVVQQRTAALAFNWANGVMRMAEITDRRVILRPDRWICQLRVRVGLRPPHTSLPPIVRARIASSGTSAPWSVKARFTASTVGPNTCLRFSRAQVLEAAIGSSEDWKTGIT
jgi:hypothetical protein